MIYPVLTYSRDLGDFPYDLKVLYQCGLRAIRLIYKGKTETEFNLRLGEIQEYIGRHQLDMDILIDLPGSKPIVGDLNKGLDVQQGMACHLTARVAESALPVIPTTGFFNHAGFSTLVPGDVISIADDELNLMIKDIQEDVVLCTALNAFYLTSNRSISVKNKPFAFSANSEKDILFVHNLKAIHKNVSLLVSFTKNAGDLRKLRAIQPDINIIPKIETVLDDKTLLEIMAHCQTLMLGRGDLSTSSMPNELFAFQQRLIDLCRIHNKQLIIGTGLLAGIGEGKDPAIAEVMDYGYLRHSGIEGFLIAGSNAHKHPLETLRFMQAFES